MRITGWTLCLVAAWALGASVGPAATNPPAWADQAGCASSERYVAYGAPACGAPGYGALVPGCCEWQPSRCDHIWDGYCQERCHGGGWFLWRPATPCFSVVRVTPSRAMPAKGCITGEPVREVTAPTAAPSPPTDPSPSPKAAEQVPPLK